MSSKIAKAIQVDSLKAPKWIKNNIHYEVITGSQAYGINNESSDFDIYAWVIPPKDLVFPHFAGYIEGFGKKPEMFSSLVSHGHDFVNKEYDFTIFSVVNYLSLCIENNPNMIDTLFVPTNCITAITRLGQMVRDQRNKFLHRGCYPKFRGYAMGQMTKMANHVGARSNPKRAKSIEQFGYDTKFATHTIRLLLECEQILTTGDIDLQRDKEMMRTVRSGQWTLEEINVWVKEKELTLSRLHENCSLPAGPDWKFGQNLLLEVLEDHYGTISDAVSVSPDIQRILADLDQVLERYKHKYH